MSSNHTIKSKKVLKFFKDNPQLNIDATLEIFVEIMSKLMTNIKDDVNNQHNTLLLKQINESIQNMNEVQDKNAQRLDILHDMVEKNAETHVDKVTTLMHTHRDNLIQNMRDTMKSNHVDMNQLLRETIDKSESTLSEQIKSCVQNDSITGPIISNMEEIHASFKSEILKVINDEQEDDKDVEFETQQQFKRIENAIGEKYRLLDEAIKTRIDSYFQTNQNTNQFMFSDIVSKLEKHDTVISNMGEYLNGQIGSSTKGKQGEKRMEVILSQLNPSAEIMDTSGKTACGDFIIKRKNKMNILLDTKDYKTVLPVDEIEKIIRDMENNKCHGILVSHNSGIATKDDCEIGIDENRIVVYLHNVNYNPEKVHMAINVIDHLDTQLKYHDETNDYTISKGTLNKINEEYRALARQKETLIASLKKHHKEVLNDIMKFNFSSLSTFLDSKFQNTKQTECICPCGWIGKNRQALSAHKRFCTDKDDPAHMAIIEMHNHV